MNNKSTIRAWKDAEYRDSLSAAERNELMENPAGLVELGDSELEMVAGNAAATRPVLSFGCCDATLTVGSCRVLTLGCCPEKVEE
jgi:mersacidin/lichenicidin family type 2 lantibiotic